MTNEWITINDAAKSRGVLPRTVYQIIKQHRLRTKKQFGRILLTRAAFEKFQLLNPPRHRVVLRRQELLETKLSELVGIVQSIQFAAAQDDTPQILDLCNLVLKDVEGKLNPKSFTRVSGVDYVLHQR